jgi:hypothetical protein
MTEKKDWWGWWYFALFPLIVLGFLFFVGIAVPILHSSFVVDGKLVIVVGVLGPTWFMVLVGQFLPSEDRRLNRAWRDAIYFWLWFCFLFLFGQWLFSVGILPPGCC